MSMKKRKFNSRFPPARIKKMMQSDEDVGKVAAVVPCLISKTLEIFSEQLMLTIGEELKARNARTLSTSHIKSAIRKKNIFVSVRDLAEDDSNGSDHNSADQVSSNATKRKNSSDEGSRKVIKRSSTENNGDGVVKRGRGRPRKNPLPNPPSTSVPKTSSSKKASFVDEDEDDEDLGDEDEDEEEEEV